jgi:glycosyltransferase involved in cell wall biosynthesis
MLSKNRAIVSVTNDLYTDQRVHKICLFLEEQGYQVLLVGRNRKSSLPLESRSYKTKRMNLFFDKGALFYAEFNLRLFLLLLLKKGNLFVSNDLDTLLANYCASILKRNIRLVYDSHEYFTEVPELVNRPKIQRIWEQIEERIFPKLRTVYTVNTSIAELYKQKYKKDLFVVRNISMLWKPEVLKTKQELNLPIDKRIIILQGAGINIDRGAEEAVEAMKFIEKAILLIVGDGDVIQYLKMYVEKNGLSEKVLFVGRKPYQEMMNYTFHADLGLTLDKATNINYKNSLPNKVFDYIHTETPIVATPIFEVKRIVEKYNVGKIVEDFNTENLAILVNSILSNEQLLDELKTNCKIARDFENWEKEKEVLKQIYPKVG